MALCQGHSYKPGRVIHSAYPHRPHQVSASQRAVVCWVVLQTLSTKPMLLPLLLVHAILVPTRHGLPWNLSLFPRHRVVVSYPPQSEAELELKEGDIVFVHKKREDGWFKGTLQRNGKTGLFPGSFVENIWGDSPWEGFKSCHSTRQHRAMSREEHIGGLLGGRETSGGRACDPRAPTHVDQPAAWRERGYGFCHSGCGCGRCALYCLIDSTEKPFFFFKDI